MDNTPTKIRIVYIIYDLNLQIKLYISSVINLKPY